MNKHDAIYAVAPTAAVIRGDDAFDVAGNPVAYDEAAVQAYMTANAYKTLRQYPPIGDQLDDLFRQGAFSPEMAAQLKAVKTAHPKGTS